MFFGMLLLRQRLLVEAELRCCCCRHSVSEVVTFFTYKTQYALNVRITLDLRRDTLLPSNGT